MCSVFTSRQKWFNAAKLQSDLVGSVVVRSVIVAFLWKHFFSKYPFNFGGNRKNTPGSILKNTLLLSKMNCFISYYNSQPFNARESLIITPQIKSICSVWWRIFIRIFKDVKPTAHLQKGQGFHSEHKLILSKECEETRVLASCERREDVLSCSDVYFVSQEVIV